MESENETRMIVIAPTSEVTPDQMVRFVHSLARPLTIKETCYGAMIEGKKDDVMFVLREVRKLDPNRIFSKIRGFPIGDTRRCRAHHGSRPGFTQLEKEWKDLSLVEKGLSSLERGERASEPKKKGRIPVNRLKKIVDEVKK
ncbi:MAG: methanogenesis marker 6 protein [Methanomassiliicoccales archaeon]|nr:methanogenesis marker 6 protein [Methanomassiliicoccales archaeon]